MFELIIVITYISLPIDIYKFDYMSIDNCLYHKAYIKSALTGNDLIKKVDLECTSIL